ncbi:MAG: helix-turn-helix domain-containing protein [Pseudomonadota bacterium]|nr:helix-turn-helix domain-containing protein [Pseudomonadota bacterium]
MLSLDEQSLWHQETVPIQYVHAVVATATVWDADHVIAPSPQALHERFPMHVDRIPLVDFIQLCFQVIHSLPQQGIGYDVGWHLPPSAYGNLGYAMLCSETLRESVTIMRTYWPLITKTVSAFDWYEQDKQCVINLTLNAQLTGPLRILWAQASMASWHRCIEAMLGHTLPRFEYWMDFAEPAQSPPQKANVGNVQYNMPAIQFRFPARYIDQPLPMANPTSLAMAVENCRKDMHLNGLENGELVARVKALLTLGEEGYPSLDTLADHLNLSSRTLRRRLSTLGYGYKSMLDQARRQDAIRLLNVPSLTVQQVSELLGYSDPASFNRVFRQWTGCSPQRFRLQTTEPA